MENQLPEKFCSHCGVSCAAGCSAHVIALRNPASGVLFHSDRGIEYAAHEFRDQLARLGLLQSMNRAGKMNDNAHMESFFHSLKTEELYGKTFSADQELRNTLNSYIGFYNQQRLHSSLHYLPPAAYEQRVAELSCVN
jgi:putative transposase